jgi:hypothetical protein
VIRKGSRAMQQLPASPDAFVWLRLYQQQLHGLVASGPDDPLWWTLRRPFRPLGSGSGSQSAAVSVHGDRGVRTRGDGRQCVS